MRRRSRARRPKAAKAKAEPGYRFYALYDKISREDILAHAYAQCRSNKGAPGVDRQDFEDIEAYGVERWLGELALGVRKDARLSTGYGARLQGRRRSLFHAEHSKVDRSRHRLVSGVVRMQMVAVVIFGLDVLGIGGIAGQGVEIDHPVELAARADPVVDRLLSLWKVCWQMQWWADRSAPRDRLS